MLSNDQELVAKMFSVYTYGIQQWRKFWDRMELCWKFINDQQWSEEELKMFRENKRIPIVVNVLRNYIWHMLGILKSSRINVVVSGVDERDDPIKASFAQRVLDYISYVNSQEHQDDLVFLDGLLGMGVWHIYFNPFLGISGRVCIERVEPGSVIFDPNTMSRNLSDCRWVIRRAYMRPEEIKRKWNIDLPFNERDFEDWWRNLSTDYRSIFSSVGADTIYNKQNDLYLVLELYERFIRDVDVMIDPQTGMILGEFDPQVFTGMMAVVKRPMSYIRRICFMPYNMVVLANEEYPSEWYPYVPFFSSPFGSRFPNHTSYCFSGLDIQREINIRRSNFIEYMQRDLRGGGWVPDDPELAEELNRTGGQANRWFNVKSPAHIPQKITPGIPAEGIRYLESTGTRLLEMVMALSTQAYGGIEVSQESGVHRQLRRAESQTTIFHIIDNFNQQKALVAKVSLDTFFKNITNPMVLMNIVGWGEERLPEVIAIWGSFKRVREWDIRVGETLYNLQVKRDEWDRKLQVLSMIVKVFPNILRPSDLILGSGISDEQELANRLDEQYMAFLQIQQAQLAQQISQQQSNPNEGENENNNEENM